MWRLSKKGKGPSEIAGDGKLWELLLGGLTGAFQKRNFLAGFLRSLDDF